jgi:hypothetical protein
LECLNEKQYRRRNISTYFIQYLRY